MAGGTALNIRRPSAAAIRTFALLLHACKTAAPYAGHVLRQAIKPSRSPNSSNALSGGVTARFQANKNHTVVPPRAVRTTDFRPVAANLQTGDASGVEFLEKRVVGGAWTKPVIIQPHRNIPRTLKACGSRRRILTEHAKRIPRLRGRPRPRRACRVRTATGGKKALRGCPLVARTTTGCPAGDPAQCEDQHEDQLGRSTTPLSARGKSLTPPYGQAWLRRCRHCDSLTRGLSIAVVAPEWPAPHGQQHEASPTSTV